jgi:3-phosphoshikimate 1-carboxyvinyltransferase
VTLRSRFLNGFQFTPELPGDKSITHRAFILSGLAFGETRIQDANSGADCRATLAALEKLGVRVTHEDPRTLRLAGMSGGFVEPQEPLDLGNSGTGLRLLLGALAAQPFSVTLTGDDFLKRRPVERVLAPLRAMGAVATSNSDRPPVTLTGGPLRGARHTLDVPSAQVKSALLLAGLQAKGETWIGGVGGTRDHTERLLPLFGAHVGLGDNCVWIRGPVKLTGTSFRVPRDPSAGAFYLAAAAIRPGAHITLEGVSLNLTRIKVLDVLSSMGLTLDIQPSPVASTEPQGTIVGKGEGPPRPIEITSDDVPFLIDELPVLAVVSAFAEGRSTFRGAGELRVKESNRLEAVAEGLNAIGARVTLEADGWTIDGSGGLPLKGGKVRSHGDHRIAMALLVAGLNCRDGVEILDEPLIETSDPFFPQNLARLMGES